MQCDFCGSFSPHYAYPASDFIVHVKAIGQHGEVKDIDWISNGEWMACQDCARDIDAGDMDELIRRSPPMQVLVNLEHRAIMRQTLETVYNVFDNSRTGDRLTLHEI